MALTRLLFLAAFFLMSFAYACDTEEIMTQSGTYCGLKSKTHKAVDAYLGIEYAKAKRWEEAHLITESSKKDALSYGPMCPQLAFNFSLSEMNEACLYLNVWKPQQINEQELLPVIFYIHGGGFVAGSASMHGIDEESEARYFYDGANLAGDGKLVVVTINYRLGAFGFLKTKKGVSGNFGLSDQAKALEWVKNNIKTFGGDPENITIMGQSAGAMSVLVHGTNPDLKGEFKGAVAQSPYLGFKFPSSNDATEVSTTFFSLLKEKCQKYLMTYWDSCEPFITTEDVLDIQKRIMLFNFAGKFIFNVEENFFPFSPYIDHQYVQGNLIDLKLNAPLPLILSTTKDEANFMYPSMVEEGFGKKAALSVMEKMWDGDLMMYASTHSFYSDSQEPLSNLFQVIDDAVFTCSSEYFAQQNAANNRVYLYYYAFIPSYNPLASEKNTRIECDPPAVCHAEDVPMTFKLFGTVDKPIEPTDEELSFASRYIKYLSDFAYTQRIAQQPSFRKGEWILINNNHPYFHASETSFSKQFHCKKVWFPFYKTFTAQ